MEVVQGEGGIVPLPGDYLRGVEVLCRKHDILFICDEVQAGLCRTGTFWAFQQHGLTPDAISMAKSLANGLPMGAMLATDEMAKGFEAGSHATTFGGGALASGVAAKCVEIMLRDKLADRAAELGKHVMDRVRAIQDKLPGTVREVRGLGLMIGIEVKGDRTNRELAATLATAKEMGYDRVIAVHQPFTFSRTKMLMDEFAKVLSAADQVVLLPIMGGREKDDGTVKSEDLAAKLPGSVVVDGLEGAANWVKQNAKKGDLVVCMSCGDLYKAADMMAGK